MKIAIDYDFTISLDPELWERVIIMMLSNGDDVRIVTFRDDDFGNIDIEAFRVYMRDELPIIYTAGELKAPFCLEHHDWVPDIWIDDNPHWIGTVDRNV